MGLGSITATLAQLAILIGFLSSLAAGRKSLTYFNHDPRAALQEVTFDLQDAKKIFFESFHKVLGTVRLSPAGPNPLAWPSLNVVVSLESQTLVHLGPLTLVLLCSDCQRANSSLWEVSAVAFPGEVVAPVDPGVALGSDPRPSVLGPFDMFWPGLGWETHFSFCRYMWLWATPRSDFMWTVGR